MNGGLLEYILFPSLIFAAVILIEIINDRKGRKLQWTDAVDDPDAIFIRASSETHRTNECGHLGPFAYVLSIYGGSTIEIRDGKYCPQCMMNSARAYIIRCAKCGGAIWPGYCVALYAKTDEMKFASVARPEGEYVLGCMRRNCCISGAHYGGNWDGRKFIPRFGGKPMSQVIIDPSK